MSSIEKELADWLPLRYEDGPDFCTVTDANGDAFALTVRPEKMKLLEQALRTRASPESVREALKRIRQLTDEANGPSRYSLLSKIAAVADAALTSPIVKREQKSPQMEASPANEGSSLSPDGGAV